MTLSYICLTEPWPSSQLHCAGSTRANLRVRGYRAGATSDWSDAHWSHNAHLSDPETVVHARTPPPHDPLRLAEAHRREAVLRPAPRRGARVRDLRSRRA